MSGAVARLVGWGRRRDWSYEILLALLLGAEACVLALATAAVFSTGRGSDVGVSPLALFALLFVGATVQRALEEGRVFSPGYEAVTAVALTLTLVVAVYAIAFPGYRPWDPAWLSEAARGFILRPTSAARPVWGVTLLVAYAW